MLSGGATPCDACELQSLCPLRNLAKRRNRARRLRESVKDKLTVSNLKQLAKNVKFMLCTTLKPRDQRVARCTVTEAYRVAASALITFLSRDRTLSLREEGDAHLASTVDYIFSLFYIWYLMYKVKRRDKRVKAITCPRCRLSFYAFTNYCPNCKQGVEKSYADFRRKYPLKPEEDVIGRMGLGIAQAVLDAVINEEYVVISEFGRRGTIEIDAAIMRRENDARRVLLLEAKMHPAAYVPVIVKGELEEDIPHLVLREDASLSDLIEEFLRQVDLSRFSEMWQGLWREEEEWLNRAGGLLYGYKKPYDDTKNKPGVARTDDLKKALAQVAMYSALRLRCKAYDLFTGIFSNVYPKGVWGDLLRLVSSSFVTDRVRFKLVSAIIGLTRNYFLESEVRQMFKN